MGSDFAWLETWRGEFSIDDLLRTDRWAAWRSRVSHPTTIFTADDIAQARGQCERHAWAAAARDRLLARVAALGAVDATWAATYVPATTPMTAHFTMCPVCEFAPKHGAYTWSPDAPEQLVCQGCGTVYPNADYPEDVVFQSCFDPAQQITFYGGKSWSAYGYAAIHSSWSGQARVHQCKYAAQAAEDLALAYALTGDARYAAGAAAILRRFAAVHPRYLVHSAYGDIADMDPRRAAVNVATLPADEWCPPGNVPDRKLYPGYWMVMRWGASAGMEGTSLHRLILAYDLVAATLDDADRRLIEHDLLLDAAPLFFADPAINNKTGMNRAAVALIGIVCGDPLLVRVGLDGFVRAVRDWWLPDGGTPESIGYASMMLHGVWRVAEALRHYSDPPDVDLPPARLDHLDLYAWPRYRAVWQAMARPLLPTLDYPLLADNRLPCHLSPLLADVLARAYPDARHDALAAAVGAVARDYGGRIAQFWYGAHLDSSAPFYRRGDAAPAPLAFDDDLGPYLNIGTLRSGPQGASSAIILSAADWKGHHHYDHLNLYYWHAGREWLTDLGYLWDMEDVNPKVRRTLAHHLVLVDGEEQAGRGRRGTFHLMATAPGVKVMEASSNVYAQTQTYRRTLIVIGDGPGEIVVDLFRVAGGATHDWVMHGPHRDMTLAGPPRTPVAEPVYDLTDTLTWQSDAPWSATWAAADGAQFCVHVPVCAEETVFLGQGFGQRAARDRGATVPYLIRRRTTPASLFVTVYAAHDRVTGVEVLQTETARQAVLLRVQTVDGPILLSSAIDDGPMTAPLRDGQWDTDARLAAVTPTRAVMLGGATLRWPGGDLTTPAAAYSGHVHHHFVETARSGLVIDADPALAATWVGQWLAVCADPARSQFTRWVPIVATAPHAHGTTVITRQENDGYNLYEGATWRFQPIRHAPVSTQSKTTHDRFTGAP